MKHWFKRLLSRQVPSWSAPLALLLLCSLSYSLLIRYLGYYWDDLPFIWISQKLGSAGLVRYFHTNRPVWGLFFQITTPLLGHEPWHWHLFALFWRWVASVLLWWLLRLLWQRHQQPALWISMLFAVYPGSQEQLIALVFSHFFIVLSAFFASLAFSILAVRRQRFYLLFSLFALLLCLVNLLSMEYFFMLELLRPALLWMVLGENKPNHKIRLQRTLIHSLPYLLLFLGVVIWRAFFFSFQTANYELTLLNAFRLQPLKTLFNLLLIVIKDIWLTSFGAWVRVFNLPDPADLGRLTTLVYAVLVVGTAVAATLYLFFTPREDSETSRSKPLPWAPGALLLGLLGLLLAGPPYWLVGLPVSLDFPNSRLTLSFILGASLLVGGVLGILPLPRLPRLLILGLCLSMAAGLHFQTANTFRRDGDIQKLFFWQMSWRIPALEPGTALLFEELPLHYSTDNSLTAMLNWIYSPDNDSAVMDYYLFYPSMRLGGSLPPLGSGEELQQNYLAAVFYGDMDQTVALVFNPPGCLRVLDPQIEPLNNTISELMRSAASYAVNIADSDVILPQSDDQGALLQTDIFGEEPAHGWCYYFEKADLARQLGNWEEVVTLGEQAFASGDYPNDPVERFPFIEGYAHTGDWSRALELTEQSFKVTSLMQPMLCRLWQRIDEQTTPTLQKEETLQEVESLLQCGE